ncbi:MAG: peptidylprolyl isomerase [Deltaproteobacteria bacterium]|nr:peptidylprolyl isomerase [Deltaproteobacteria bacterium]MBW2082372.1 peptidylprolyl isomerase [Deltaproteobacteria bacterium]HDM10704.1 hypothetical protein [Desulfobacteraceae bacterium]
MKRFLYLILILLICGLSNGCNQGPSKGDMIALQVGNKKISLERLKKDIAFQGAELIDANSHPLKLEGPLLESLVDYYLIQTYAEEHGISVTQAELLRAVGEIKKDYPGDSFEETLLRRYVNIDEWKEALRRELVKKKVFEAVTVAARPPSFQQIEKYYRTHVDEFKRPQRVRFRQIVTRSLEKAKEALSRINKGESIANLAPLYSYSPEATKGGEVGWVEKGQLPPSMDNVLFSLPVGKVSRIVKSPYGYHIFQVMDIVQEGLPQLRDVADKIQSQLYSQAREEAFKKWLAEQRANTTVKVMTKTLERTRSSNEKG